MSFLPCTLSFQEKGNTMRKLLLLLLFPSLCSAQDSLLTIRDAIIMAMKSNYDLRISSNKLEQAEINNAAGNAGMLPQVNATGSYTKSTSKLDQKFANGLDVNKSNVGATNASVGAGLTWTIFDGLKMFYTKDRLEQLSVFAQTQLKQNIEQTLLDVISNYYTVVRNEQLLKAVKEQLTLSVERVKIAERRLNNGSGSKLDLLQAQTERNRQRSNEINTRAQAETARLALNKLLARKTEQTFSTEDTVIITYHPSLDELKSGSSNRNSLLNLYRINNKIVALQLKENQSKRYPIVSLNSQYNYLRSTSEAGFTLLNQQRGFNYGITATLPLYNGSSINRQIKNSKLDVLSARLELESAEQEINFELLNTWRNFNNSLEVLTIEEENIRYASEILYIAQERYRVGSSSSVELQDAQRNFEESMLRLADARYTAKLNETLLRKLNGELVENK